MTRILISSCEYGDFKFNGHEDKTDKHNGYEIRSIVHTDRESLMSRKSMHPRMYGKINRMMNWALYPGYDFYIWRDCRISFLSYNHIIHLVESLTKDIGLFHHRGAKSIKTSMGVSEYTLRRYTMPIVRAQINHYLQKGIKEEYGHFETGLFVFRKELVEDENNNLMRMWLSETMMWSENDQLSLPYCLEACGVEPQILEGSAVENKWTVSNYLNYE
jgi:hypothetical protein